MTNFIIHFLHYEQFSRAKLENLLSLTYTTAVNYFLRKYTHQTFVDVLQQCISICEPKIANNKSWRKRKTFNTFHSHFVVIINKFSWGRAWSRAALFMGSLVPCQQITKLFPDATFIFLILFNIHTILV